MRSAYVTWVVISGIAPPVGPTVLAEKKNAWYGPACLWRCVFHTECYSVGLVSTRAGLCDNQQSWNIYREEMGYFTYSPLSYVMDSPLCLSGTDSNMPRN